MAGSDLREQRARAYRVGVQVVWASMWVLTAVVLRSAPELFGAMIAVLLVGTVVSLGLRLPSAAWTFLVGQLVLWVPVTVAAVLMLAGTDHLLPELLVLGGGVLAHLVTAPFVLRWARSD